VRGLYPIVDVDSLEQRGLDVLEFAERVLAARPELLQLRAKRVGARDTVELLRELLPRCRRAGALLFANDRPDLALLAGCDGIHVGQDDLAILDVRAIAGELRIGVSTHDLGQLTAAIAARPDYVALGPIFTTVSKERPDPLVGLEMLARAHELTRAAGMPLVAIGGVDLPRAATLRGHCELGAVIAALLPDDRDLATVTSRARALHVALS
jgi:thiamine-phosphate pyrophosphorylase